MVAPPPRYERLRRVFHRVIYLLARPNTFVLIAALLLILLIVGTLSLARMESEPNGEPRLAEMSGAFTYMLQNVSGVGLGAASPGTGAGRAVAVSIIILAAAARAVLVAAIVSGFVGEILAQGKGKGRARMQNHVIICGFNSRVGQIVEVLKREAFGAGVPITLLAQLPQDPLPEANIKFVSGNPSHSEDLERANVKMACAAIAVTDESDKDPHMDSTYDARAVLTVLALKSANPNLHVVAQMRDPANRVHFERARADEIIASAEMSEGLLARAALSYGIGSAFSSLLRLDTPQEMYIIDAPPNLAGKTFQAALIHEQLRNQRILIGVIEGNTPMLCPPIEYRIHEGLRLILLGNVNKKDVDPRTDQPDGK